MTDAILALNVGSSSIKFQVFHDFDYLPVVIDGEITDINENPIMTITRDALNWAEPITQTCHHDILTFLFSWLNANLGSLKLKAVGHRIVHGGADFVKPILVNDQVLLKLAKFSDMAPLHQPLSIDAVKIAREWKPDIPHIACFDTSFHANHETVFDTYPLPPALRDQGIRRYGFHGLSYEWIVYALKRNYPQIAQKRIVAAHLGSGASLCAIRNGKSVDTSMGMTVLDGLPMSTRCGSIDPGIVLYMMKTLGLTPDQVEYTLYQQSGLKALSGNSGNIKTLIQHNDAQAKLALDYFCLKTAQYIAMMAASMGGIDALIFTGGVGENISDIRMNILGRLNFLMPFDTLVIPTNEERMIAMHVFEFCKGEMACPVL